MATRRHEWFLLRVLVFAFVVTWIALYKGYTAEPTSPGISACNDTNGLCIARWPFLGLDFVLTAVDVFG